MFSNQLALRMFCLGPHPACSGGRGYGYVGEIDSKAASIAQVALCMRDGVGVEDASDLASNAR